MSSPSALTINDRLLANLAAGLFTRARAFPDRRYLLGVAGIPGAGKSTLASRLMQQLDSRAPGVARLVSMDGFHLANWRLEELDLRDRKGSPTTFDVEAYIDLLTRVREEKQTLRFPIYQRMLHEPVIHDGAECLIDQTVRVVVTEGNYLLVDQPPWSQLVDVLDECWYLDTPIRTAKQWLIARHRRGGRDLADAEAHYHRNDLPNAHLVLHAMRSADLRLLWD